MKKSIVLALVLCLTGCGKKENVYQPTSQELRLNLATEPPTLDPRRATDTSSIAILNLCFEGLTQVEPDGQVTLASAEKIAISEDKKKYTFTLKNAQWSDGEPLKAQDFEKTWKTLLDPSFPCDFASDLYIIKNAKAAKMKRCDLSAVGIKALDEKTLQIDLEYPVPYFLSALATHTFFATPSHVVALYPGWTEGHYVGNGPFIMTGHTHRDLITFEKNPHYWNKDDVKLEKIIFTLVEDETTELTMYENAELDFVGSPLSSLPTEALDSLKKKGTLHSYSSAGTYYYVFNTKAFPFTNANIRKAFSLAINREAIVTNVTQMKQTPAMTLVPPMLWKNPKNYFKDHDLEEAQRCLQKGLKELGIALEDLGEITLSFNTLAGHNKIAQAIQQQWRETLGVNVKLDNKEWKVFLDELRHHKFQVARMGGMASVKDPTTFLDFFRYLSSSNNHSQWTNPKFSELLEEAELSLDEDKRMALLQAAEKMLIDEMPIAPIYFYTGNYLQKGYVKGVFISELGNMDLKKAYIELNDQISH